MVDQPNLGASRSYKIRGHTRQRASTKPYARVQSSERKKRTLFDTVKEYLSPNWFFGYLRGNEPEDVSDSDEEAQDEDINVIDSSKDALKDGLTTENIDHREIYQNNTRNIPAQGQVSERAFAVEGLECSSKIRDNNNIAQKKSPERLSRTLSGELHDDDEDIEEDDISRSVSGTTTPEAKPLYSFMSHQFKRRPLVASTFSSQTPSSSAFQPRATTSFPQPSSLSLSSQPPSSTAFQPRVTTSFPQPSSLSLSSQAPSSTTFQPRVTTSFPQPSSLSLSSLTSRTRMASYSSTPTTSSITTSSVAMDTSRSAARPAMSKPGFSVSTFVKPVQKTFGQKRTGSPFYPGPTMYGGASSAKRQRKVSPRSETQTYQSVRKQRIMPKELPNASQTRSTTQTAQRILKALESFSSPLKDVRKIPSPNVSASPLSFPPSKLRTLPPQQKLGPKVSFLQSHFLPPPVQSLSIPENAKILRTGESKNTRATSTADASMFSGLKDTVLKTSLPTGFTPKPLPTSLSPCESASKATGKMRTVSRGATHYSSGNNDANDEVVNSMPEIRCAVPLPLNKTSKLISTTLFTTNNKQPSASKQDEPKTERVQTTESPKNGFIFSTPKPKTNLSVKDVLAIADDEVSFLFSQPVHVKTSLKEKSDSERPQALPSFASNFSKTMPDKQSGLLWNEKSPEKPLLNAFTVQPGQWECSVCMIRNKMMDKKCIACENPAPSKKLSEVSSNLSSKNLSEQFGQSGNTWECDTCMVHNKADNAKCVACTNPKPGSKNTTETTNLKAKFAPAANSWECDTCLVPNKPDDVKCVACTNPKPGSNSGSTSSNPVNSGSTGFNLASGNGWNAKFTVPVGSWVCEVCMISNKAADVKCVACETNKPGTSSSADSSTASGFMFGTSTGGNNTGTITSSGFIFGGSTASETPSSASGFTFGSNGTSTSTTVKSTAFIFGGGDDNGSDKTTSVKFGSTGNTSDKSSSLITSGFKFGSTSDESSNAQSTTGQKVPAGNVGSTMPDTNAKLATNKVSSTSGSSAPSLQFGVSSTETKSEGPANFKFGANSTSERTDFGSAKTDTTDGLKHAGNTASKPAVVSGSFTFGTTDTAAVSTTVPTFQFGTSGTKPDSGTTGLEVSTSNDISTSQFTFGSGTSKPVSTIAPLNQSGGSTSSTSTTITSGFKFGTASTTTTTTMGGATTMPVFKFGAGTSADTTATATPPSTFKFGAQSTTQDAAKDTVSIPTISNAKQDAPSTAKITPFVFGTATTPVTSSNTSTPNFGVVTKKPDPKSFTPVSSGNKASFSFGTVTTPETSGLFKFGTTAPSEPAKNDVTKIEPPMFSFTAGVGPEAKAKTGVFNFGANNTPTTNNATQQTAKTQGLFTFSTNQPFNPPVNENQNSLGGEDMEADTNNNHDHGQPGFGTTTTTTGGFNFTGQTAGTNNLFGTGSTGTAAGFNFGASSSSGTPAFQFGTPNNNTNTTNTATPSGGFSFNTSTPAAGSSPFVFGVGATAPSVPSNPSVPAGAFSFGGQQPASNNTTPSFNFTQATTTTAAAAAVPGNQRVMFNVGGAPPAQRVIKKALRRKQQR